MFPIAGLVAAELNRKGEHTAKAELTNGDGSSTRFSPLKAADERHHPHVIELIANEIEVAPSGTYFQIIDFSSFEPYSES